MTTPRTKPTAEAMAAAEEIESNTFADQWGELHFDKEQVAAIIDRHFAGHREVVKAANRYLVFLDDDEPTERVIGLRKRSWEALRSALTALERKEK